MNREIKVQINTCMVGVYSTRDGLEKVLVVKSNHKSICCSPRDNKSLSEIIQIHLVSLSYSFWSKIQWPSCRMMFA